MTGPVCMVNIYYQDMTEDGCRMLTADLMNDLISGIREEFPDLEVSLSLLPGRLHGLQRISSGYADEFVQLGMNEMFPFRPAGHADNGEYEVCMYCQMNHVIITAGMKRAGVMRHTLQTLRKFGYECMYTGKIHTDEDIYPVVHAVIAGLASMIDENLLKNLRSFAEERKPG